MRKHDFISTLAEKANITIEDATNVNEIIESHSIVGKKSKEAATIEIAETLGINYERADEISNTSYDIIGKAFVERIKHPFGE